MPEIVKGVDSLYRVHSWLTTRFIDTSAWIRDNRNLAIGLPFKSSQVFSTYTWRGVPILRNINAESMGGDVVVNLEVFHDDVSVRLSALFGNGVSQVVSGTVTLTPGSDRYAVLTPDLSDFLTIGNDRFTLIVEFACAPGSASYVEPVFGFGPDLVSYTGTDRTADFYGLGMIVAPVNDKGLTPPGAEPVYQGIRREANRVFLYPYLPNRLLDGVTDYFIDTITMQSLASFSIKSIFVDEQPDGGVHIYSSFPWSDDDAARVPMQGGQLPRALMASKVQGALKHNWKDRAAYFSTGWQGPSPHSTGANGLWMPMTNINAVSTDFPIAEAYSCADEDLVDDYPELDIYLAYSVFGSAEIICTVKVEQFALSGTLLQTDTFTGAITLDGEDYLPPAEPGGYGWATQAMISLSDVRENDIMGLFSPQELRYTHVRAYNQKVTKVSGTRKVRLSLRMVSGADALIVSPDNHVMVVGGWIKYAIPN